MHQTSTKCRHVYIVSDGTGITAQHLAHSLMSQFEGVEFITSTIPYVDSHEKALAMVEKINANYQKTQQRPIVFATLVNPTIRAVIQQSHGHLYDLFQTFLNPLEDVLQTKCSYTVGRSHGLINEASYQKRIDAINYALAHDDGVKINGYQQADLIIVGVSRCGKTPTSLYLAMQFGVCVANYPLTEEDGESAVLPARLIPHRNKLYGLTIAVDRLQLIRQQRRPNSPYASKEQCQKEIRCAEEMFSRYQIPYINSTYHSIEEIATRMLASLGIERHAL